MSRLIYSQAYGCLKNQQISEMFLTNKAKIFQQILFKDASQFTTKAQRNSSDKKESVSWKGQMAKTTPMGKLMPRTKNSLTERRTLPKVFIFVFYCRLFFSFSSKTGQPRPLFIFVYSNTHYNFYNK